MLQPRNAAAAQAHLVLAACNAPEPCVIHQLPGAVQRSRAQAYSTCDLSYEMHMGCAREGALGDCSLHREQAKSTPAVGKKESAV